MHWRHLLPGVRYRACVFLPKDVVEETKEFRAEGGILWSIG